MVGIYRILSPTGRAYIGQTIGFRRRAYMYKTGRHVRDKISQKAKGRYLQPDYKEKQTLAVLKARAKKFIVYNQSDMEIIGEWENVTTCATFFGIKSQSVRDTLKKRQKSYCGMIFKYDE